MSLTLTRRADGECDVITVDGELDVYTANQLRELLIELANRQERRWLAINLDACDYLDSTALGVLVTGLSRARTVNGDVVLICTLERILKVFRMTGLTKVFLICDTDALALAVLREKREIQDAIRERQATGDA